MVVQSLAQLRKHRVTITRRHLRTAAVTRKPSWAKFTDSVRLTLSKLGQICYRAGYFLFVWYPDACADVASCRSVKLVILQYSWHAGGGGTALLG